MTYKTEYSGCFNEDDFAQRGETLEELTVTITLCEYRNMVRELARSELQIERLQDEKEKLLDENGKLSNALAACKLPEWVKSIGRALAGEDAADEEAEDGEKEPGEEMKRLTERTREGVISLLCCNCPRKNDCESGADSRCNFVAYDRLAEYEDTGLTPEEIEALKGGGT